MVGMECGFPPTMEPCVEPAEEERCVVACVLESPCEAIADQSAFYTCITQCATPSGVRDYCTEYLDKLDACLSAGTALLFDFCDIPTALAQECALACILDAPCAEFADELTLQMQCQTSCVSL